jgi:hypothetical protein
MDGPKPLDASAEDWLWSIPWATVPECDWSAVILCLRGAARAEFGEFWQRHDIAEWADLIEGLTSARLADEAGGEAGEWSDGKAECY